MWSIFTFIFLFSASGIPIALCKKTHSLSPQTEAFMMLPILPDKSGSDASVQNYQGDVHTKNIQFPSDIENILKPRTSNKETLEKNETAENKLEKQNETSASDPYAQREKLHDLHQILVAQVALHNNEELQAFDDLQSKLKGTEEASSELRANGAYLEQVIAQNPANGQFYALTPIEPHLAARIQSHQLHAAQAHVQRQLRIQATQLQQLQTQTEKLLKQNIRSQQKQIPPKQTQVLRHPPQHPNFGKSFAQQPHPQIIEEPLYETDYVPPKNDFEIIRQHQKIRIRPQPPIFAEQSLPSQTMKGSHAESTEAFDGKEFNKLVGQVGLSYTPVEDTPQYTIYKVKEPAPHGYEMIKSHEIASPLPQVYKANNQPNAAHTEFQPFRQTNDVLPSLKVSQNKPKFTAHKPQVPYNLANAPKNQARLNSNLVSSLLKNDFRPLSRYELAKSALRKQVSSKEIGPAHVKFIELPRGYDQKPFRPSPLDLRNFRREPLFEEGERNQQLQATVNHVDTVHPPQLKTKYVEMEYSPGITLPPNEAAFAAIQAQQLGGPAFVDPGFLIYALGAELNGKTLETRGPNALGGSGLTLNLRPVIRKEKKSIGQAVFKERPTGSIPTRLFTESQTVVNVEPKETEPGRRHFISSQYLSEIIKATSAGEDLVKVDPYFRS